MTTEQKIIKTNVGVWSSLTAWQYVASLQGDRATAVTASIVQELNASGSEEALREISRRTPNVRNHRWRTRGRHRRLALGPPAWGQHRVTNELAEQRRSISPATTSAS